MSKSIGMLDIPFAPLPELADTIPPTVKPREPLPFARPRRCIVVAWRNDGGLDHATFDTVELGREHAAQLHFVVYYKFVIQAGRDLIDRGDIAAPAGYELSEAAFRAFCRKHNLG